MPVWVRAFLLALLVAALLPPRATPRFNQFDQPFYLGIAYDIRHSRVFTDGYFFAGTATPRPPGMRMGPLYPGILAALAQADTPLRASMDCLVESAGDPANACPSRAPLARALQAAALAGIVTLTWWMGAELLGPVASWIAFGLALLAAPFLMRSVMTLMTEITCLFCTTAATAAALRARRDGSAGWAALSGALLALAALTRPAFLYLIPASLAAGARAARRHRRVRAPLAAGAAASCLTLAPWYMRNWLVLGRPALTFGYASHTLAQRLAFNTMSWREYGRSFVCWFPGGAGLYPRHACDRFGWDAPDSFYLIGQRHFVPDTLRAAGGYAHHLSYLIRTLILPHPFWHAATTLSLALRGAYIHHFWGLALLPLCLACALRGPARFGIVAWPALFMAVLNAAVSVNQPRYNLMLVPPYAIAGAWAAAGLWARLARGGTSAQLRRAGAGQAPPAPG